MEVKILIKGYAAAKIGGKFCSTVVLVKEKNMRLIVDPGTVPSQKLLINQLKKNGLKAEDINLVFITHAHTDHYRNAGLFKNARLLDYWGLWKNDRWEKFKNPLSKNIRVLKTPGHSDDGLTLLVKTKNGMIAICGDVFWKKNYPLADPYATDAKKLQASRKKILKVANYIIPGHGQIYQVN